MNKTAILFNLIISLFSVVKAINETTASKASEEITEKKVESVTIENSYGEGLSNVVNKYDFLSTKKLIGKNNPSKAFFVKIRQLENDKPFKKNPDRNKTSESLVTDMIDRPQEGSVKTLSNETERINEDTTELIVNFNISEIENTTEGKTEENKVKPLEDDIKHKSVSNKSVVDEDSKIMISQTEKSDDDDEILPSDDKTLDDIRFSRRMMSSQYSEDQKVRQDWDDAANAQKWKEVKNEKDWEDLKSGLFLEEDRNVLLDVKARSDESNTELVKTSKTNMKPEFIATTPESLSVYGNNIMNDRAKIRYPHLQTDVSRIECLHNPANLNMLHDKPVDLINEATYDRRNLENTYFLPTAKNNDPYPQLSFQDSEQPVDIMQHQNNDFLYSDLFSNAYPYSHKLSRTTLQEPLGNAGSTVLSKLIDASEYSNIGDKILKYNRRYLNSYEPKITLRPYYDTFKYFNRFRR